MSRALNRAPSLVRSLNRASTKNSVASPVRRSIATAATTSYNANNWKALFLGTGVAFSATAIYLGSTFEAAEQTVDYDAVRKAIEDMLDAPGYDDGSYGPLLVRLAWHSSGTYNKQDNTGGSSGGRMRFEPEASQGANAGLGLARAKMEDIKKQFPGISYGDLYTLAGAVAIEALGGPHIPWRPGRVDENDGKKGVADVLPDGAQGASHVREVFTRMGFNDQETTALVGAHAIGRCHTSRSGFDGPWTRSPTAWSNDFYIRLKEEKWVTRKWSGPTQMQNTGGKDLMMMPADMAFLADPQYKKWVDIYAEDEDRFNKDFAAAFSKLLELGVDFPSSGFFSSLKFW